MPFGGPGIIDRHLRSVIELSYVGFIWNVTVTDRENALSI